VTEALVADSYYFKTLCQPFKNPEVRRRRYDTCGNFDNSQFACLDHRDIMIYSEDCYGCYLEQSAGYGTEAVINSEHEYGCYWTPFGEDDAQLDAIIPGTKMTIATYYATMLLERQWDSVREEWTKGLLGNPEAASPDLTTGPRYRRTQPATVAADYDDVHVEWNNGAWLTDFKAKVAGYLDGSSEQWRKLTQDDEFLPCAALDTGTWVTGTNQLRYHRGDMNWVTSPEDQLPKGDWLSTMCPHSCSVCRAPPRHWWQETSPFYKEYPPRHAHREVDRGASNVIVSNGLFERRDEVCMYEPDDFDELFQDNS